MSDITKLPDLFRRRYLPNTTMRSVAETLATEVEAAMPVGTIITENESTWPEYGVVTAHRKTYPNGDIGTLLLTRWYITTGSALDGWLGVMWWPIPKGMFEPPEDK